MAESAFTRLLDPGVLARLMAQPVVTRLSMLGSVSGHHKSPHRGSSVEFAEYRNYVPGDDIRRLDWRVFARTDRFYLKEFEADTNMRLYLVVDCSGSMAYEGSKGRKLDYARKLAATMGYLAIHQGDACGLHCVRGGIDTEIPPRRNASHLQLVLETLDAAMPSGETGLIPALHEVAERIRPRAMVAVFSDFFCPTPELLKALQHLKFRKHDVALFHVLDRAEIDFPFERPVRFADLESDAKVLTEPSMVRDEYLRLLAAFMEELKRGANELGIAHVLTPTDQDYERLLSNLLADRAQAVRLG